MLQWHSASVCIRMFCISTSHVQESQLCAFISSAVTRPRVKAVLCQYRLSLELSSCITCTELPGLAVQGAIT